MAQRGKPLPFPVRQQIKIRVIEGMSIRAAAREVGVNRETATKYAKSPPSSSQNS